MAASKALPKLAELDLSWNLIDDAGVRALANSPLLGQLASLNLDFNPQVGDQGIVAMARSDYLNPELKDAWRRWVGGPGGRSGQPGGV